MFETIYYHNKSAAFLYNLWGMQMLKLWTVIKDLLQMFNVMLV